MIKIQPFKIDHLDEMKIKDHEKDLIHNYSDLKSELSNADEAVTIMDNGSIVCSMGINGNIAWLIPSKNIGDREIVVARAIKRICKKYKSLKTVCVDNDFYYRWMQFLNFDPIYYFDLNGSKLCLYEKAA